jgi:hypothetical protein
MTVYWNASQTLKQQRKKFSAGRSGGCSVDHAGAIAILYTGASSVGAMNSQREDMSKADSSIKPYPVGSDGGMIRNWTITMASSGSLSPEIETRPVIYDDDPELAAMSDAELVAAAKATFGAWAERVDIGDDWLNDLRSDMSAEWERRIAGMYGPDDKISF